MITIHGNVGDVWSCQICCVTGSLSVFTLTALTTMLANAFPSTPRLHRINDSILFGCQCIRVKDKNDIRVRSPVFQRISKTGTEQASASEEVAARINAAVAMVRGRMADLALQMRLSGISKH